MTQPPYIKTCCCYGDGCNGNQDVSKYKVVQEENMPVQGLRCYQGQSSMDQPVNSTGGAQLRPCLRAANAICGKELHFKEGLIARVCTVGNCTDQQGQPSFEPVCKNLSTYPYVKQCCCHGDGCNI
ncbi:hypothetical protein DdX_17923 [Ditylenchus destructor]|uniref:Uncharacterized protein n=1 Tax=Ditylenchus destructor TaxID=166010 RepID=A0AAD4MLQ0_9BILA|nr:hypothetical protein DdX_17923 [Ditylenchus destructor]